MDDKRKAGFDLLQKIKKKKKRQAQGPIVRGCRF
jgi:hypothetical protein